MRAHTALGVAEINATSKMFDSHMDHQHTKEMAEIESKQDMELKAVEHENAKDIIKSTPKPAPKGNK
jgi:hypothetical protein